MTADSLDAELDLAAALAHLAAVAGSATPETQQALAVVLPLVTDLVPFPEEWGVRFVDENGNTEGPDEGDEYADRSPAEQVVGRYVDARLVKRTSFRGPWMQVDA